MAVTIYHNPSCGTSRNTLAMIRQSGAEPCVIEYLKTPPTRERLVDEVLSRKFSPFDRSIDMHVSKLRKKLGDSEGGSDHIKTVRGVGYIFTHPREQARSGTQ